MDPLTALGVFALAIVVAGVVSAGLFAKRAHKIGSAITPLTRTTMSLKKGLPGRHR
jgi:cytochrome b